jgi:RNA-directed DNA polymerase
MTEGKGTDMLTMIIYVGETMIARPENTNPEKERFRMDPQNQKGAEETIMQDEVTTSNEKHHQLEYISRSGTLEEICDKAILRRAFKLVKRNKGAPGIDGKTIEAYEANLDEELDQLRNEILNWKYKPKPVKRVEIPKPDGKGVRLLGIPIVKDRILHMAIKMVLEPIIDPKFSDSSFGFRPKRNQRQAVEAAHKIVQNGKEFVVDIDLSKFFDRINHDRLIHQLKIHVQDKRVLRLIGMILRCGIMIEGSLTKPEEGSVQGSPLSPLLSNVVLDELDKELERRGLEFCRYADDCNIFVKSKKAADRVMSTIKKFIEKKLKLKVNDEKSKTAKSNQVKFLGMTIYKGTIAISQKALKIGREKVKQLIPRRSHKTLEETIDITNKWYQGWASYFKMTHYPFQLKVIEAHIRRRLRARIVSNQKKRKHLYKLLLKRGMPTTKARDTAFSNRKVWDLSHSVGLEHAFRNKWFIEELGQLIFSDRCLPGWFAISVKVKLT